MRAREEAEGRRQKGEDRGRYLLQTGAQVAAEDEADPVDLHAVDAGLHVALAHALQVLLLLTEPASQRFQHHCSHSDNCESHSGRCTHSQTPIHTTAPYHVSELLHHTLHNL